MPVKFQKFELKDKLWRNLPSQYLEDAILCSSPKDALNWLLVSKDIKEVIEENRDKMRRWSQRSFSFFFKSLDDVEVNPWFSFRPINLDTLVWPHPCAYVDARPKDERDDLFDGGFAEELKHYWSRDAIQVVDAEQLGLKKVCEMNGCWIEIKEVWIRLVNVDVEVLRPLIDLDTRVCFVVHEYDDTYLGAIKTLGIRNLEILDSESDYSLSFLDGLALLELDSIHINRLSLIPFCNCANIFVRSCPAMRPLDFFRKVAEPWLDGGFPRLKFIEFRGLHTGDWAPLERLPHVPTEDEEKSFVRFYGMADKKGERFMKLEASRSNFPRFKNRVASIYGGYTMSAKNPKCFELNPKLWRNLPSQLLEDSLLCSSPEDALKWLLVSKDTKEHIEENRDKMRRFGKPVSFFFKQMDDVEVNPQLLVSALPVDIFECLFNVNPCIYVDGRPKKKRDVDGGFAAILERHSCNPIEVVDAELLGLKEVIQMIADWIEIREVRIRVHHVDVKVLRPLIDKDTLVSLSVYYDYDDTYLDAVKTLGVRNLKIDDTQFAYSPSFLNGLALLELDSIHTNRLCMIPFCNCSNLFVRCRQEMTDFVRNFVAVWENGGWKGLKYARFYVDGIGDGSPLQRLPYVSTEDEEKKSVRFYGVPNKKDERFITMEESHECPKQFSLLQDCCNLLQFNGGLHKLRQEKTNDLMQEMDQDIMPELDEDVWKNLPLHMFHQVLEKVHAKDTSKWNIVSPMLNEFLEKGRHLRKFDGGFDFFFEIDEFRRALGLHPNFYTSQPPRLINCNNGDPTGVLIAKEDKFKMRLNDRSLAGFKSCIKRILRWYPIKSASFHCGSTDLEILREIVDGGLTIEFSGELNDEVLDSMMNLGVKKAKLSFQTYPAAHRLHELSLKKVELFDSQLLPFLDSPYMEISGLLRPDELLDLVIMPWYHGNRPRLQMMTCELCGELESGLFVPIENKSLPWFDEDDSLIYELKKHGGHMIITRHSFQNRGPNGRNDFHIEAIELFVFFY